MMKTQNHSIAMNANTADLKKSPLALNNSDLPSLRGTATVASKMNVTSAKGFTSATVISTIDGPKGVPIAADALFIRASNLANAFSTASEGELLACGLTPDELEDLQVKSTSVSFVQTQKNNHAWH